MAEITSSVMPSEIRDLLAYAASTERAADEYEKYVALSDRRLYGFTDGGVLVGCIGVEFISLEELEIKHIAVEPTARGKGFGHAMIKAVQKKLRPNVIVAETDSEAVDFYRSLGFEIMSLGEKYPGVERFWCRLKKPSNCCYPIRPGS